MNKVLYFFLAALLVCSCSGGHKKPVERMQRDAEAEFTSSLSESDTLSVLKLSDHCMTLIQNGKISEAVSMIYVLSGNQVYQKNDAFTNELIQRFTQMPVKDFKIDYYSFSTEGNNDICYLTEIATGRPEGMSPVTMRVTFNPVFVNGEWYLTMKDGHQPSKLLPENRQVHPRAPAPEKIILHRDAPDNSN